MKKNENVPLWIREFGSAYKVPATISNDASLVDTSWHNDTHPTFIDRRVEDNHDIDVRLWVDHVDAAERESNYGRPKSEGWHPRYAVWDHLTQESLYEGDNMREAIGTLKATVTMQLAAAALVAAAKANVKSITGFNQYELWWKNEGDCGPYWVAPLGSYESGQHDAAKKGAEWITLADATRIAAKLGADLVQI